MQPIGCAACLLLGPFLGQSNKKLSFLYIYEILTYHPPPCNKQPHGKSMAAPVPNVVIDNQRYFLQPNPKEHKANAEGVVEHRPRSLWAKIGDYQEKGYGGVFRTGQFLERITKILNHFLQSEGLKNLSSTFSKIWTGSVIARVPEVVDGARAAFTDLATDSPTNTHKVVKVMVAIDKGTDAVSTFGYLSSMILFCFKSATEWAKSILKTADTITFVGDVNQSALNGLYFNKCRVAAIKVDEMNVAEDVKANFKESTNFYLLKTLKAVCSVAGFILGLALATSGLVAPGIVLMGLGLSLASNLLAMSADFYSAAMKYQPIKPFDTRVVQVVPQGIR